MNITSDFPSTWNSTDSLLQTTNIIENKTSHSTKSLATTWISSTHLHHKANTSVSSTTISYFHNLHPEHVFPIRLPVETWDSGHREHKILHPPNHSDGGAVICIVFVVVFYLVAVLLLMTSHCRRTHAQNPFDTEARETVPTLPLLQNQHLSSASTSPQTKRKRKASTPHDIESTSRGPILENREQGPPDDHIEVDGRSYHTERPHQMRRPVDTHSALILRIRRVLKMASLNSREEGSENIVVQTHIV